MASDQQFCLRWNNHQSTLVSVFDNLLESQTLVDCTLAADGQYLKAHKVVLSACSPYLEAILCQNLDKHPILILKDVKFSELKAMLDYMYRGEVNISQEQLSTFLKAAESLQIKGLTDSGGGGNSDRDRDRDREPLKRQDLRKPLNQPVPHIPQPRPVVPHPGLMERRSLPHFPPHIADMQPQSPRHAREGSTSPTARKRRRPNRPSSDDSNFVSTPNSLSENQPDTSDSCDVPVKQAASSTPNVPNATTKAPETDSNRTTPQPQNNQLNSEQKQQQVTVKKEFSEALLTPKTEFDYGNDNSMEDVTYEDDEEEEVDLSKPGTSFAANSQGFPPWQMGGDGSNDDSNNMYSPDVTAATNQNNSQVGDTKTSQENYINYHGLHDDPWFDEDECGKSTVENLTEAKYSPKREVSDDNPPNSSLAIGESISKTNQDPGISAVESNEPSGQVMEIKQETGLADHKENLEPCLPESPFNHNQQSLNSNLENENPETISSHASNLRKQLMASIQEVHKLQKQPGVVIKPPQQLEFESKSPFGSHELKQQMIHGSNYSILSDEKIVTGEASSANLVQTAELKLKKKKKKKKEKLSSLNKGVEVPSELKAQLDKLTNIHPSVKFVAGKRSNVESSSSNAKHDFEQESLSQRSTSESSPKISSIDASRDAFKRNSSTSLNNTEPQQTKSKASGDCLRSNSSNQAKNETNKIRENISLSNNESVSRHHIGSAVSSRMNVARSESSASFVHTPHTEPQKTKKKAITDLLELQRQLNLPVPQSNVTMTCGNNSVVISNVSVVEKPRLKKQKKEKGSAQVSQPPTYHYGPTMAATSTSTSHAFAETNRGVDCKQDGMSKKQTKIVQDHTRNFPNQSLSPGTSARFGQNVDHVVGSSAVISTQNQQRSGVQVASTSQQQSDSAKKLQEILSAPGVSGVKKSPIKSNKKMRCTKCTDIVIDKKTHVCQFRLKYKCPFCSDLSFSRQAVQFHRRTHHFGQRCKPTGEAKKPTNNLMPESSVLVCNACGRKFGSLKSAKAHQKLRCGKSHQPQIPASQPSTSCNPANQNSQVSANPKQPKHRTHQNFKKPKSPPKVILRCDFVPNCNYRYTKETTLAKHIINCHPQQLARASHNQQIASSSHQPTSFNQSPTSFNQPPTTSSQPPTTSNQPPTSSSQPPISLNQPPTNFNQPPTSSNQPLTSFNQPLTNFNQPPTSSNQPPTSFNQPPTNFNQLPTSFNQPPTSFNLPPPNFNQPPPNFNQPPPNFNQPPPNFNQLPPNFNQLPPNFNQPPTSCNQPTQQGYGSYSSS